VGQIEAAKKNIADRASRLVKKSGNATRPTAPAPRRRRTSPTRSSGRPVERPHQQPARQPVRPRRLPHPRERHGRAQRALPEGARRIVSDSLTFESTTRRPRRQHVERLLARDTQDAEFARRVIHTGSPLYDKAFGKQLLGHNLTTQEQATLSEGGITSATLPVPITIDPTVILTNNGVRNPLRALARNVSITGMTWTGISSDGVTASYDAELAEVSDDSPTFSAPTATVAAARAFVPFSIELDQDWGNLRTELTRMFVDSKDTLEATKFLTGSGTNEPLGLLTALTTGSGTASIVVDGGDGGDRARRPEHGLERAAGAVRRERGVARVEGDLRLVQHAHVVADGLLDDDRQRGRQPEAAAARLPRQPAVDDGHGLHVREVPRDPGRLLAVRHHRQGRDERRADPAPVPHVEQQAVRRPRVVGDVAEHVAGHDVQGVPPAEGL
jgi:hypothetical protein